MKSLGLGGRGMKIRKKNYKDHKCTICDREFKSVRNYVATCSKKCFNYSRTQKYWDNIRIGLKIDPHNPPKKMVYRRIVLDFVTPPPGTVTSLKE